MVFVHATYLSKKKNSCDENNAMVFNFVNFDEIGGQFKGNLERDCKCEIAFWGIVILNISWKTLKW
jgi:hypothetical protein